LQRVDQVRTNRPTGGQIISQIVRRHGVNTAFALAGASHTHLLKALDEDGLKIVSSRHESGCVGAADGYARVSQKLGVALIIAEQGIPNAVNAVTAAYYACSPVLVLIAELPKGWAEPDAEVDVEKHPLLSPVTKWARTVPSAARLREYIETACRHAMTGRKGPVALLIPQQFLSAEIDEGEEEAPWVAPRPPQADPEAVMQAARMIAAAERALIITGAGATWSCASEPLRLISQQFGIPALGNGLGRGLVPEDDDLGYSWAFGQLAAPEADLVLVLGARLKQRLGYGRFPRFGKHAKFIQVDIDAEAMNRNRAVDLPIVADVRAFSEALLGELARSRVAKKDHGWIKRALAVRYPAIDELASRESAPIHHLRLARALADALPEDAVVVGDGANILNWLYGKMRIKRPGHYFDHYPLGSMGSGLPMAIGAIAAAAEEAGATGKRRPVVHITGDGAFGFYCGELHAAVRADLPLVTIIANDGAWGTEFHGQKSAIGRAVNTELGQLPYEKVAEGFGCVGARIEQAADLEPAIRAALASERPIVLNVLVDPGAGATLKGDKRLNMVLFNDLAPEKRD
jgi:acetolactate synthase-1/2/3 large subunit